MLIDVIDGRGPVGSELITDPAPVVVARASTGVAEE
jgi:hypothetical protein